MMGLLVLLDELDKYQPFRPKDSLEDLISDVLFSNNNLLNTNVSVICDVSANDERNRKADSYLKRLKSFIKTNRCS